MLRSYDPGAKGVLSHDKFRAALDRLHLGLTDEDKDKIIRRCDPHGKGVVDYAEFLR